MPRPAVTLLLLILLLAGLASSVSGATASAAKLNVVLILADDLGWTDLATYGSDFHETPHLDRLARAGVKFTQSYSACTVCSPTRAALLTGKYPARLRITDWIPGAMPDNPRLLVPDWTKYLPAAETTLAEVFQAAGYATASIGKWHLGGPDSYPEKHGFDVNIAGTDKPQPPTYHAPWNIPTLTPEGQPGEYVTDRLAEEAVRFIDRHRDRPFFLYLPHFAVHTPIQGRADLVAKYQRKLRDGLTHRNAAYAAMTESLDAAVGRVVTRLEELSLRERTIVVFTSDNGGRITQGTTSNAPLRYGKASAYEGGVRVPLIIAAPGIAPPGRVSNAPVITMDLFPTLVELAGLPVANTRTALDGVSLASHLRGGPAPARDALFWHYPHHQHYQLGGAMPYAAIRAGDFKLIEFFHDLQQPKLELYHVRADIGEMNDLAAAQPHRVAELRARLHAWQRDVGAQLPTPNPNYDPLRPEYTPPPAKAKKASKK